MVSFENIIIISSLFIACFAITGYISFKDNSIPGKALKDEDIDVETINAGKLIFGEDLVKGPTINSNGEDLEFQLKSGNQINIPKNIGLSFGDNGEKIESDGIDLSIKTGGNLDIEAINNVTLNSKSGTVDFTNDGVSMGKITTAGFIAGEIRLVESDKGSNYTGFKAPASITSSHIYTLPDDLPTGNGILQSSNLGVLSWVTNGGGGGGSMDDLVDDTAPQLGGNLDTNSFNINFDNAHGIHDDDNNEQLIFKKTNTAVNYFEMTNSATNTPVIIGANGSDDNIDIDIRPKGTGEVNIATGKLNYSGTAITTTGAELNLIDGDTPRGTDAVASGDGILINDDGTMKMTNVDTVSTYFASHSVGGGNIVTTGALNSGSITTGFGAINNGASNITTGGLLKIDADADADDLSGDSATGRLTIGADEDLNLYHGGTNSYIVNATGDLIIDTAGDLQFDAGGNDFKFLAGGTEILNIINSSSGVIIKPVVDAKDIIFQQRDGIDVARIEDNATFNVVAGKLAINGTAVTATAAELNLIDGDTPRGTDAVASGDGILINDDGTMKMTNVDTVSTYFASHSVGGGNIVTTGALNSGSITTGFGAINNGSSAITTTGTATFGALSVTGNTTLGDAITDVLTFTGKIQTVNIQDDIKFVTDSQDGPIKQYDANQVACVFDGGATPTTGFVNVQTAKGGFGYKRRVINFTLANTTASTLTLNDTSSLIQLDGSATGFADLINLPICSAADVGWWCDFIVTNIFHTGDSLKIRTGGTTQPADGDDGFFLNHMNDATQSYTTWSAGNHILTIPASTPVGTWIRLTCVKVLPSGGGEIWIAEVQQPSGTDITVGAT